MSLGTCRSRAPRRRHSRVAGRAWGRRRRGARSSGAREDPTRQSPRRSIAGARGLCTRGGRMGNASGRCRGEPQERNATAKRTRDARCAGETARRASVSRLVRLKRHARDAPPSHDARVDARHGDDASERCSSGRRDVARRGREKKTNIHKLEHVVICKVTLNKTHNDTNDGGFFVTITHTYVHLRTSKLSRTFSRSGFLGRTSGSLSPLLLASRAPARGTR